jgi:hypothetical protein
MVCSNPNIHLEGIRKPMITAVKAAVVMANTEALFSRITIFTN